MYIRLPMDDDFDEDEMSYRDTDPAPPSDDLLQLVSLIHKTSDRRERTLLMLTLAELYAATHDETDSFSSDVYHDYFDDLKLAKVEFQRVAMRVARLAVQCVDMYLRENPEAHPECRKESN